MNGDPTMTDEMPARPAESAVEPRSGGADPSVKPQGSSGLLKRIAEAAQQQFEDDLTGECRVADADYFGERIANAIAPIIEDAVAAERDRIKRLIVIPIVKALRHLPEGRIQTGCVISDGTRLRKDVADAIHAIDGPAQATSSKQRADAVIQAAVALTRAADRDAHPDATIEDEREHAAAQAALDVATRAYIAEAGRA